MKLASVLVGLGVLIGVATVSPGYAQEPAKADILLRLTEPTRSVPTDAVKRDDFRELPAVPSVGRLSDAGFRVYVGVGDPRCLPGDDLGRANRRTPRARRGRASYPAGSV